MKGDGVAQKDAQITAQKEAAAKEAKAGPATGIASEIADLTTAIGILPLLNSTAISTTFLRSKQAQATM